MRTKESMAFIDLMWNFTALLLFDSISKKHISGQVWWLTPVILALWEVEVGGSPGQAFKTSLGMMVKPCSTKKKKKIARHSGRCP